jgi:hypothetical protein
VSAMRQPIESLFNWLIQRSGIQEASKVRSTKGLLVHCYGKLTVCCFRLLFNRAIVLILAASGETAYH